MRVGSYLLLAGVLVVLFSDLVAEVHYPNYNVRDNYISDLGVGPTALIFNGGLVLFSSLGIISSLLLRRRITWRFLLLLVTSVGAGIVGVFPETTGIPHLLGALLAFGGGGVTAIASSTIKGSPMLLWATLGVIQLLSLALFIGGSEVGNTVLLLGLGRGGMERVIFYSEVAWGLSFGTWVRGYQG